MRVVLPAPFSPTMAWTSAARTWMFTSSLATTPGNRLLIPRSSTAGAPSFAATGILTLEPTDHLSTRPPAVGPPDHTPRRTGRAGRRGRTSGPPGSDAPPALRRWGGRDRDR